MFPERGKESERERERGIESEREVTIDIAITKQ
jgi:hypothetical protein